MPTGTQQSGGIDVVNPLDANTKTGPWPSLAAAKAGVPLANRYNHLPVYITGDSTIYEWLDTNLTDAGLIPRSGGTNPLAIVRDIYLVQDAATQTKMGGTANNVYITTQTAYAAADALQVLLGGTNRVNIMVYNTLAATVGDLTLTAAHNINISWTGISPYVSEIGNIIATNASGNGFAVGSGLNGIRFTNMKVGNVTTSATGTTGNSGTFIVRGGAHNIFGNIDTSISNVANTTGNGGTITYSVTTSAFVFFNNITTTSKSTTSSAGNVTIDSQRVSVGSITTCVNNTGGTIRVVNGIVSNIVMTSSSTVLGNSSLTLTGCTASNVTLTMVGSTVGTPNVDLRNTKFSGNVSVLNNGTGITEMNISENNTILGTLTTNAAVKTTAKLSSLFKIINLGNNSVILNCVIDSSSTAGTTINGIGTGCRIRLTTINPNGASLSIDNGSVVTVTGLTSVYENGNGANVTII